MPTVTSSEKLFLSCFLLLLLVRLLSYFCTATQLHFPPDCVCVCEYASVCVGNSTIAAAFVAASRTRR